MGRKDDIDTIQTPEPHHLPVRRRPQLLSFLVVGALLGLVPGLLLGVSGSDVPGSSPLQVIIVLGALGAILGGFLGSVVYLVADRLSMRDER